MFGTDTHVKFRVLLLSITIIYDYSDQPLHKCLPLFMRYQLSEFNASLPSIALRSSKAGALEGIIPSLSELNQNLESEHSEEVI